jgi:hypothetical protein
MISASTSFLYEDIGMYHYSENRARNVWAFLIHHDEEEAAAATSGRCLPEIVELPLVHGCACPCPYPAAATPADSTP